MNTELPQDDQNEQLATDQPAAEQTPVAEEVVETVAVEATDETVAVEATAEAVVEETAAETTDEAVVAETPATVDDGTSDESEEQDASAPQLTLGDSDSDSETESEEEAEAKPYVEPKIRGRIDKFGTAMGTGRRKTSVARVRIKDGNGAFTINGRPMEDYFRLERDQKMIKAPLVAVEELGKVDVWVRTHGGGLTGQTGAVILGIARALQVKNPTNHPTLAEGGFLTRDSRMVERKKYGQAKARKSFQFSKR